MYNPTQTLLRNYAKVLVNFALNSGKGIRKGEVVSVQGDTSALPLMRAVMRAILVSGAHPIMRLTDESFLTTLYESAGDEQLTFFPSNYVKSLVDTVDHRIALLSDQDPLHLACVDPKKIMLSNKSSGIVRKWLFEKEDAGKLTWTLALYGTPGMAKEANLSLEAYWQQIIRACFLDYPDPVARWRKVFARLEALRTTLSTLPIEKLHLTAPDTDLWITIGEKRKWMGGSGRNIPSFELFTSPDWRGTEGHIFFDYPLYRYGSIIRDITLRFEKGRIVFAHASKNAQLLKQLIKQKNADKIGEYSLTDKRYSRITHFMANTLYDENVGGKWGNTHVALGTSYHDAYTGAIAGKSEKDWQQRGFNESPEHCDIMATTRRRVEAKMHDGSTKLLYENGQFVL